MTIARSSMLVFAAAAAQMAYFSLRKGDASLTFEMSVLVMLMRPERKRNACHEPGVGPSQRMFAPDTVH